MFNNISGTELLVVAFVLVVLFGGKKLPELARGISKASEEFNIGLKGEEVADKKSTKKRQS